jgi:hypothetical protein
MTRIRGVGARACRRTHSFRSNFRPPFDQELWEERLAAGTTSGITFGSPLGWGLGRRPAPRCGRKKRGFFHVEKYSANDPVAKGHPPTDQHGRFFKWLN